MEREEAMMVQDFDRSSDLERARLDPGSVFTSPEQLAATTTLTRAEKIDLLRRWAYDAGELAVAEDEGMEGGEATLEARVLAVLDQLENQAG
jgi:hypothetical protein